MDDLLRDDLDVLPLVAHVAFLLKARHGGGNDFSGGSNKLGQFLVRIGMVNLELAINISKAEAFTHP